MDKVIVPQDDFHDDIEFGYIELRKARRRRMFKFFTWLLIFIFSFNQVAFTGDRIFYRYKYAAVKDLLPRGFEQEQGFRMAPADLIRWQRRHEAIIRVKNIVETETVYFLDKSGRATGADEDEDLPLKKKRGGPATNRPPERRIEYTLTDFDEDGNPQQISIYEYQDEENALKKIISYDIRGVDASRWISGGEKISEEGEVLILASFIRGNYEALTDEFKIRTIVYFGNQGGEKIDYILSKYRQAEPGEVSIYEYDEADERLTEVNTYDIDSIDIDFGDENFDTENINWKSDVKDNARLLKKAVYEGGKGDEKLVYALSEYNSKVVPGRLDCFDYEGGSEGPMSESRAYNIKGLDLSERLADFRNNVVNCDEYLISKTVYKGKKDKELIDYVLTAYYMDEDDSKYKPSRRFDYCYDENGRLDRIESYAIKNGANILRQCSEFSGLMGSEFITRSYEYETDGATINNVSVFEYDLEPDEDNPVIGGDGNKYTLDRVTKFVGTDDPHDLTGAKVKSETYYDGLERKEYVAYIFAFDIVTGNTVTRTRYSYNDSALEEINIYRLMEPGVSYDVNEGVLATKIIYEGVEKQENAVRALSYDLAGNILTTTNYEYNSNGALEKTSTTTTIESAEKEISATVYKGSEGQERKSVTTNYDYDHNVTTSISYEYSIIDALEKTVTLNSDGVKISETLYEGMENNEHSTLTTNFDLFGTAIGTTEYEYGEGGTLLKVIGKDSKGRMLTRVSYDGPENYENAVLTESFDLSGTLLTKTDHDYDDATGALEATIAYDADGETKLSRTTYQGLMNMEKVDFAESFDLTGTTLLTTIRYDYHDSGALNTTTTYEYDTENGCDGATLSVTTYMGCMNGEKADFAESFDLEGSLLTKTDYDYDDETGALESTIALSHDGAKLSQTIYEGLMNSEKAVRSETFDLAGKKLTVTEYDYDDDGSGALVATATYEYDSDTLVKLSETVYAGPMNRESVVKMITFKDNGVDAYSVTTYERNPSGAMSKSVTKKAEIDEDGEIVGGRVLSETAFTGAFGREKSSTTTNYNSRENVKSIVHYEYGKDGALQKTRTNEPDDITTSSETYYYGLNGYEITDFTKNLRDDGTERNVTHYFYNSFIGFEDEEPVYGPKRAEDAFKEDVLIRAETYSIDLEKGDENGLLLESIAYYKGKKNKEIVDFSQDYEADPDDETARKIRSTVIYEYDESGALKNTYTYRGGEAGSKDTTGLKRIYMSKFKGDKGEEEIYYMEGTTCGYSVEDYAEWDFFIRTDFQYDDEDRNTGYFERIYSPDGEWTWESRAEYGPEDEGIEETLDNNRLVEAKDARFIGFDDKDRYLKIEKSFRDWDGGRGEYVLNGKKITQEYFEYDADDNVLSYIETYVDPEEETKRYKFTFEEYFDKIPGITTSWELDENYAETGDYFRKSSIEYDDYGRETAYTATSCNDGRRSVSEIFDIEYDKDKVTRENVWSEKELIYFGEIHPERGYRYSTREYKYNAKRTVETTVYTNGDYISITNADGNNIYFEWTPDMAPYREDASVSEAEPEGAGPREGSQNPVYPVIDALQEARKCLPDDQAVPEEGAGTVIEYTENNQIEKITDAKGNTYFYSDSRLMELRDAEGDVVAEVDYETGEDGGLSVTVTNVGEDYTIAEFTYDEDFRRFSVEIFDDSEETIKYETYEYTKRDNGKVETATIHREFYEAGSLVTVDKIETYDEAGRLTEIFTRCQNPDAKSFVARWVAEEFYEDIKLKQCRETRCDSIDFAFEDFEDETISGYLDLFAQELFSDPGISQEDKIIFGANNVVILNETWTGDYYVDGKISYTGKDKKTFYHLRVTTPEGDYFITTQSSDTTTEFFARDRDEDGTGVTDEEIEAAKANYYDVSGNVIRYHEEKTERGLQGETEIVTTTDWYDVAYDVDRVTGFTQVVNRTGAGGLDVTETMTRSGMVYEGGDLVAYNETFLTSAASDLIIDRRVSDTTYQDGRIIGYTEITHEYSEDGSLDRTTTTVRHDMVFDGWGNLVEWTDEITTPSEEGGVTDSLKNVWGDDEDLQDWFPNAETGDYNGIGDWEGKTLVDWAKETGYTQYPDELETYGPFQTTKTTTEVIYDSEGRIIRFTSVEEGLVEAEADQPREWQRTTTERVETTFNSINQITHTEELVTIEHEDGSTEGPSTVTKDGITYNKYGQEYSYTYAKGGESSRVDSSTYNSLGQLVQQHTRIDAHSYSNTYYYYDEAGNVTQTKYHYCYHRAWSEQHGKDTVHYTQHSETAQWYDRFGTKTNEVKNEYVHVDIEKSFWSSAFGKWVQTAIGIVLSSIPTVGWLLSIVYNAALSFVVTGEFDWMSLGIQLGLAAFQYAGGFDAIFEGLGLSDLFGTITKPDFELFGNAFMDEFVYNLGQITLQTAVTEGIYEIGRQNDWDPFLTTAVATFSSSAVGYAYGSAVGGVKFGDFGKTLTASLAGAMAIAAIDKYAQDHQTSWVRYLAPIAKAAVSEFFKPGKLRKEIAAEKNLKAVTLTDSVLLGEVSLLDMYHGKDDVGKISGSSTGDMLFNLNDYEIYFRVFLLNDDLHPLSPVMQLLASDLAEITYKSNLMLDSNNQSLEIMVSQDGDSAYLLGDAGYNELTGHAKEWVNRTGVDKLQFELNLKTGDLYLFMEVKDIGAFFSQEGFEERQDISNLKQTITEGIGVDINKIERLELAVLINGDKSKIVGATVMIDPTDIENSILKENVNEYLAKHFEGLRTGQFNLVLDVDPEVSKVKIQGLSLNLDESSIRDVVNGLKETTGRSQKLGCEIKQLVKLADNNPRNFERINLIVDKKGDYQIKVRIKSDVLKGLPSLIAKLGIEEGSNAFNRLSRRQFTEFAIDVASGVYMLDLSLKCQKYETLVMKVGDVITAKDEKGRIAQEKIYDKAGDIVKTIDYTYPTEKRFLWWTWTTGKAMITETFYSILADGGKQELHRITEGTMVDGSFVPEWARFDDLTGLEGSTFRYVIEDKIVEFTIDADLNIRCELPCAAMGLEIGVGDSSYEIHSLGVRLDGHSLIVDDAGLLNVEGGELHGASFMTIKENGLNVLFLYNGAEIGIGDGKLIVQDGTALFGDQAVLGIDVESLQIQPEAIETPFQKIGNIVYPPAFGEGVPETVTLPESNYQLSVEGEVLPLQGIFRIKNNGVLVTHDDTFIKTGQETVAEKDILKPTPEVKIDAIGEKLDKLFYEDIDSKLWPLVKDIITRSQEGVNPGQNVTKLVEMVSGRILEEIKLGNITKSDAYIVCVTLLTQIMFKETGAIADMSSKVGQVKARFILSYAEATVKRYIQTALEVGSVGVHLLAVGLVAHMTGNYTLLTREFPLAKMVKQGWQRFTKKWGKFFDVMAHGEILEKAKGFGIVTGEATGYLLFIKTLGLIPGYGKFISNVKGFISGRVKTLLGGIKNALFGKTVEKLSKGGVGRGVGTGQGIEAAVGKKVPTGGREVIGTGYRKIGGFVSTLRGFVKQLAKRFQDRNPKTDATIPKRDAGFGQAIDDFYAVQQTTKATVQFMAETFGKVAGKVRKAAFSEQADSSAARLTEGANQIIAGTTGACQAWQGAWGGAGLRRAWLAYGLGGATLAQFATPTTWNLTYNTATAIGDFINPDFTDPTSFGNHFWTGVYDDINGTYTLVRDFIRPDFTDPTSFGNHFWTGVYDTINGPYTAIKDFVNPDFDDPTSVGANFYMEVYEDLVYAGDFWANKIVSAYDGIRETLNVLPPEKLVKVTVREDGVSQVDARLNWLNGRKPMQFLYDFNNAFKTANDRWATAANVLAYRIFGELKAGQTKIYSPGVNSDGHSKEVLVNWFKSLDIPEGLKVRVAHSFATHGNALSMLYDPEGKFIQFSSRTSEYEFKDTMDKAGVKPEQVLTITALGDLPHQPSKSWRVLLKGDIKGFIESAFRGYEESPITGYHLYIEDDGPSFKKPAWPGRNHGIQEFAFENARIIGVLVTPDGERIDIVKEDEMHFNTLISNFLNDRDLLWGKK